MSASREKKQRQGSGPSDKAAQANQKQAAYKRKVRTYTSIGVVVAVLAAALLIWNSGFFQSRALAATVGDNELSAAELSYYYYDVRYPYTIYSMIDTSVPDDEQIYDEEEGTTYHDFFLDEALQTAQSELALYDAAIAAGYSQEDIQDDLDASIASFQSAAASSNYSYRSYLVSRYGKFMTPSIFERLLARTLLASLYANDMGQEFYDSYSTEDLEAYYEEHADDVDDFEYSYLYFTPEAVMNTDDDGNERTEEELEELTAQALADAEALAEEALAAYEDGTDVADLIEEYEPNSSGDHTTVTGTSSISSTYRDELLDLGENEATVVENGESGYYLIIFHSRGRNEDLTADVRHILIRAETTTDEDGNTVEPTDEAWESALSEAEDILAEYEAGELTAEAFGELANEYSDDTGSNTTGGLYEAVARTDSYVEEFLDWIFEDGRQAGDTGIVRHEGDVESSTSYWGYHIMYFQGWNEAEWMLDVRSDMSQEDLTELQDSLLENDAYAITTADGAKYLGA